MVVVVMEIDYYASKNSLEAEHHDNGLGLVHASDGVGLDEIPTVVDKVVLADGTVAHQTVEMVAHQIAPVGMMDDMVALRMVFHASVDIHAVNKMAPILQRMVEALHAMKFAVIHVRIHNNV